MKTPIKYYGGKQRLLKYILPLIPAHTLYVEPFFGGGAVFWAKSPSKVEVINDKNAQVIVFYEVLKTNFAELHAMVRTTLYSRTTYKVALGIYSLPHLFSKVHQAWAFWVLTNQGFGASIQTWGYGRSHSQARLFKDKKLRFTKQLAERVEIADIECNDALRVIESRDTAETFFYLDPPYIGTDQGHYKGYSDQDYIALLDRLVTLKGKFLLSSYPSQILTAYIIRHDWQTQEIPRRSTTNNTSSGKREMKTELLVWNYSKPSEH